MMQWLNPWALAGLLAVGVPLLIHLLGRQRAQPLRFPTLRFLGASRLVPTRRKRITDLPLLIIRMLIVAAAAIALAQPWLDTAARRAARQTATARTLSRAVILDPSASMSSTANGAPPADSARKVAALSTSGGSIATTIETDRPATAIDGAAAWLSLQPGRRELVIVS